MRNHYLTIGFAILVSGCTMIPDIDPIKSPVSGQFPQGAAYKSDLVRQDGATLGRLAWQNFFKSPELKNLIVKGLANNRDLKEATLNIQAARAQYRIQRAELFPEIVAGGLYRRQKLPEDGNSFGASDTAASGTGTGTGAGTTSGGSGGIVEQYSASIGATAYELDLFGRVRSLNEAALNDYFATAEARESVRITLINEIAAAYLTLLADRELLRVSDETLKSQEETYNIINTRFENGITSALELRQSETLLEQARADRIAVTRAIAQDENALWLLIGADVNFDDIDYPFNDDDMFVADLPSGLPSDLLTNRPDVRAAEYTLRSENANIGAARAAFFPSISLTTTGGTTSDDLANLFSSGTYTWLFSPQINLPIFAGGRLKGSLDLVEIRKDIAVVQYERAIQEAFRDVADALAADGTLEDQLEAQARVELATRQAYELGLLRYETGVENYLTALDARRELYTAQQQLVNVRLEYLLGKINLYKALGGGSGPDAIKQ